MNLNKNIVLLGMMGSGKSTIGYLLSKSIKLKFFDVDRIIEKKTGLKINNIFEIKGEVYFRNLEEKITLKLLKNKNRIMPKAFNGSTLSSISCRYGRAASVAPAKNAPIPEEKWITSQSAATPIP